MQVSAEGGGAFNATSSVVAAATAEKLGDLFQYTVGSVSLPALPFSHVPNTDRRRDGREDQYLQHGGDAEKSSARGASSQFHG